MSQSNDGQALSQRSSCPPDIDWPGLRAAAIALQSVRLAAIKASAHLPPDEQRRFVERVNKRAYRERWLDKAKALSKPRDNGSLPLSKPVQTGADALAHTLAERRQESVVHLSKYAVQAGKRLADSKGNLKYARQFQQIAAGRANVFPEQAPSTRVQVNVLSFEAVKRLDSGECQDSGHSIQPA